MTFRFCELASANTEGAFILWKRFKTPYGVCFTWQNPSHAMSYKLKLFLTWSQWATAKRMSWIFLILFFSIFFLIIKLSLKDFEKRKLRNVFSWIFLGNREKEKKFQLYFVDILDKIIGSTVKMLKKKSLQETFLFVIYSHHNSCWKIADWGFLFKKPNVVYVELCVT